MNIYLKLLLFILPTTLFSQNAWTCKEEGNDFDGYLVKASIISESVNVDSRNSFQFPSTIKMEVFVIESSNGQEYVETVIKGINKSALPTKISIDGQIYLVNGRWAYGGFTFGALEIVGKEETTYLTTFGLLQRLKKGKTLNVRLDYNGLTQDYSLSLNASKKSIDCVLKDFDNYNKFN